MRGAQTAIAAQRPALVTAQEPGTEGGQLAAQIGLVERPESNLQPYEARENIQQFDFGASAAEDEMRMLFVRRDERVAGGLDGRVAGLNRLLRERKIGPDKDVNVGRFAGCRLPEVQGRHGKLSSKWQETSLSDVALQWPCRMIAREITAADKLSGEDAAVTFLQSPATSNTAPAPSTRASAPWSRRSCRPASP